MAIEFFTGSEVLTDYVCSCGHAVRRHWNDGGCGAPLVNVLHARGSWNDVPRCPCALTRIECQFHVIRAALHTPERVVIRHKQHLREHLREPLFVPSAVRWYVSPAVTSPMMVLFRTFTEAIEFATRDWIDPLGIGARVEL